MAIGDPTVFGTYNGTTTATYPNIGGTGQWQVTSGLSFADDTWSVSTVQPRTEPIDDDDWKIAPIMHIAPEDHAKWDQETASLNHPLDPLFGDDMMPSLCKMCNGVYWGTDMQPMLSLLQPYIGQDGNLDPTVIQLARDVRKCKPCNYRAAKADLKTNSSSWFQPSLTTTGTYTGVFPAGTGTTSGY